MHLVCQKCGKQVEYSGERPRYCMACGAPLADLFSADFTHSYRPGSTALRGSGGSGSISQSVIEGSPGETSLPTTVDPDAFIDLGQLTGQKPPERIGNYRIIRRLGGGGMGTVYEAEDEVTGKRVAIKVIRPQMVVTPGALDRFRQEGRLASLIAHPQCVFVLKADEDEGRPYIVMELMPGATLKDLVKQQGVLPPAAAVTKMMDVLDGLAEAHSLGVIHRDVKPSNCFLMTDGRVKIGDFGLSKLVQKRVDEDDASIVPRSDGGPAAPAPLGLTRTGAFLGTPLFASPEQIRGEPLDFRTDVYSAAATLYFLLTGQAPYEGGDANAIIAKIVSEPPPPISRKQARVPAGLERAIVKGLQQKKEKRWQSIDDFKAALVPYLPAQSTLASRSARFRALVMDAVILLPLLLFVLQAVRISFDVESLGRLGGILYDAPLFIIVLAYFGLLEGLTGATLGKRLMRLRVRADKDSHQPRKRQMLVRQLVFFGLIFIPGRIAYYVSPFPGLGYALNLAGLLVILDTMRRGNGYRGLHDLLSRTKVVQLPWPEPRLELPAEEEVQLRPLPPGWPGRIGPYRVQGLVQANQSEILVAGEDPILERPVWLSVQPQAFPAISPIRREISRPTRLRWLASGTVTLPTDQLPAALSAKLKAKAPSRHGSQAMPAKPGLAHSFSQVMDEQVKTRPMLWDAVLAGEGSPLPELLARQRRLTWGDARAILEQLTDELAAAAADGTMPLDLEPGQVWVQTTGRIQLIGPTQSGAVPTQDVEEARALKFLEEVAVLLLEGKRRPVTELPAPIRAPIPSHDRWIANKLVGLDGGFANMQEVKDAFKRTRGQPAALTTPQRFSLLWVVGTFLAPFLLAMFLVGRYYYEMLPTVRLNLQIRRAQKVLKWLSQPEEYAGLFAALQPGERALVLRRRGPLDFIVVQENQFVSREQQEALIAGMMRQQIAARLSRDQAEYTATRQMMALAFLPDLLAPLLAASAPPLPGPQGEQRERLLEIRRALRHAQGRDRTDGRDDPVNAPLLTMNPLQLAWGAISVWPLLWVLVAAVTGGGLALRLLGCDLVRDDGRPARAWQCALRALLLWLPIVLLLGLSITFQHYYPERTFLHWGIWWLAVIVLALYGVSTLVGQGRALPDRLAGVHLLPK